MLSPEQARELLQRYHEGLCTAEETAAIEQWYSELLDKSSWDFAPGEETVVGQRVKQRVMAGLHPVEDSRIRRLTTFRLAAACLLVLLGTGIAYYLLRSSSREQVAVADKTDALPGSNRAILTLANGNTVVLDSAANGTLAQQGAASVQKLNNGQLAYYNNNKDNSIVYNTLSTPRGGQYQLTLPDGTGVWLNAASSIRYPTSFSGSERKVEITGEAYLEVAQMANKPFKVIVNNQLHVQVLGTSFNINAYQDEHAIRTTLLSGRIQVASPDGTPLVLKPGNQASLQSGRLTVGEADGEQVLAWKNGYFHFDRADIQTIMRQVARWYDVEIIYEDIPQKKFSGTIPRDVNVSKVFKILELTGNVHFSIKGNKVTVKS